MTELWKTVPGFPGYEVSDLGSVRSWKRNGAAKSLRSEPKPVSEWVDDDGYRKVRLTLKGHTKNWYVHRLVLTTFVGPCPSNCEARHVLINDPADCRLVNLAWGTKLENMHDKRRHGSIPTGAAHWTPARIASVKTGERCALSLLTDAQAIEIIQSSEKASALAARFGVRPATIQAVRIGRSRPHLHAHVKRRQERKKEHARQRQASRLGRTLPEPLPEGGRAEGQEGHAGDR